MSGRLRPHVGAVYPLAETVQALKHVADARAIGTILIDLTRRWDKLFCEFGAQTDRQGALARRIRYKPSDFAMITFITSLVPA